MKGILNVKSWLLQHQFTYHLLLLLIVVIVAHFIVVILYKYLFSRAIVKQHTWTRILLLALRKPLAVLIWYLGIVYGLILLLQDIKDISLTVPLDKVGSLGIVIISVWFLLRLIKNAETSMELGHFGKHTFDKTTIDGVIKLSKIVLLIIAILAVLQTLGVPLAAIYTAAGGAGIGITLAAQDLLKNIFGGLMLYFDRPFNIGDWISSPDKQIEGTVEKIGWRTTRIRTFDKRPLYVPNSTFLVVSVENPSRMLHRRIRTDIGVRYCDFQQIPKITQDIEAMLRQHPDIAAEQTIWVNLVNFASSSLEFRIYAFTKTTAWVAFQKIQQAVFIEILAIIEKHGAEAAFPSQTLYVPDDIHIKTVDEEKA